MKRILAAALSLLIVLSVLAGCSKPGTNTEPDSTERNNISTDNTTSGNETGNNSNSGTATTPGAVTDLGDDSKTFGESLDDLNAYAGYFEEDSADIVVECVSGTNGCYTLSGNTLTFTSVSEDSVYSVSGTLRGNIVIDIGDDYKFDLELKGLSLVSSTTNPVTVLSGDEVSITAKSEYQNYIYDTRAAVDEADETVFSGAIHSAVDFEICGKGALTIVSENNNGIHSKDDLQVKNLTLLVACSDNALKGNDSVEITDATTTLIAAAIDTEQGYQYTGGSVVAIMPSRGMTSEATHCSNFNSIGTKATVSLNSGSYLTVKENGSTVVTVQMPDSISAMVIYLGSKSASVSSESSSSASFDSNGVCWSK